MFIANANGFWVFKKFRFNNFETSCPTDQDFPEFMFQFLDTGQKKCQPPTLSY